MTVFHRSLRDSKSPQVSGTLLSILAVLNNALVWIVSTHPPTSKSSSPFNSPLVTVPKAPITIGIIVTMFYSFSIPKQGPRTYPSFHFLSVLFCSQPGQQSPLFQQLLWVLLFKFILLLLLLLLLFGWVKKFAGLLYLLYYVTETIYTVFITSWIVLWSLVRWHVVCGWKPT